MWRSGSPIIEDPPPLPMGPGHLFMAVMVRQVNFHEGRVIWGCGVGGPKSMVLLGRGWVFVSTTAPLVASPASTAMERPNKVVVLGGWGKGWVLFLLVP